MSTNGYPGQDTATLIQSIVKLMTLVDLQDTFSLGFLFYSSILSASFDQTLFKTLFRSTGGLTRAGGLAYFASR